LSTPISCIEIISNFLQFLHLNHIRPHDRATHISPLTLSIILKKIVNKCERDNFKAGGWHCDPYDIPIDKHHHYCPMTNGLIIVRDSIYVPDSNELKKVILREFHVKTYLGH